MKLRQRQEARCGASNFPDTAREGFHVVNCGGRGVQSPANQLRQSGAVGLHHRALAVEVDDGMLWVWIGTHAEYDRLS